MKTQHTPGPWARNISPAWKYPIYEEKNHNKIAYIIKDACITEAEQEANSNLIAAAPDLLQGCQAALAYLADTPSEYPENRRAAIDIIKAAIAKAKGELC